MDNFNLKKFLGEKSLLKENAPGYSTRKQGEALPTLEGIKAAFEAKNALKEENTDEQSWEEKIGNDIDANTILDIVGKELKFNHVYQDKKLTFAEAVDMLDEYVEFSGMDSSGYDLLVDIAHDGDLSESIKEDASGVEAGKTFANMTPAERKEYGNFADHADIGQFATPEEEWSNHDDDYFYNKGIEIVANEYDGDVTAAYNGVVRSRK